MLNYNSSYRFNSPGPIPIEVYNEFVGLVGKIARGDQSILEIFKRQFASSVGRTSTNSSDAGWAMTDLESYMSDASDNAALFIEAFYDGCESIRKTNKQASVPDLTYINNILAQHNSKYIIEPPNLIFTEGSQTTVQSPQAPKSLDQEAQDLIHASLDQARIFLNEGKGRQAVQELLWLLETVSTAFQGQTVGQATTVEGKYFNKIIDDLRKKNKGTALEQIINWIKPLHGFLSSPTGGGIRHGTDLKEGMPISIGEAQLYCNLITSYIAFLLSEYQNITDSNSQF